MHVTSTEDIPAAVRAELCGPGGAWETAVEDVLGVPSVVFVNRHRTLRDALRPATAFAVGGAPERWEGIALVLASPEFNRR